MSYSEAIEFLYGLRLFGTSFGLETTRTLAALCGNPERGLRFLHVAGTNGKGSVCAMLESIYRLGGCRTGLFTSPHLVSFTERIQVNGASLSEDDVARLTALLIGRLGGREIERWPVKPTFFEFVTVMALICFQEQRCQLVIWETGLGGRLDATNIVTPLASIITNVQYDHQQWLGDTLDKIAAEKAGIIKAGVPALTAADAPEALAVIRARAAELGAPLTVVDWMEQGPLSLPGAHQKKNAALARAAVDALQPLLPVAESAIREGLATAHWPGRLQFVKIGGRDFLLDGAHNPDGAAALAASVQVLFAGSEPTLLLGLFRDKDWKRMCDLLVPVCARLILVPIQNERSADPPSLEAYCRQRWPEAPVEIAESLADAIARAPADRLAIIAGSLHLIGEAMDFLQIGPPRTSERELNEWDASRDKRAKLPG